jgi:hypothetical protein
MILLEVDSALNALELPNAFLERCPIGSFVGDFKEKALCCVQIPEPIFQSRNPHLASCACASEVLCVLLFHRNGDFRAVRS